MKIVHRIGREMPNCNELPTHLYDFYRSFGWDMEREAGEYMRRLTPTSVRCIGRFGQTISLPLAEAEKAGFEIIEKNW